MKESGDDRMMIEESSEVQAVVNRYYAKHQVDIFPSYPYVLVRVLPKAQKIGEGKFGDLIAPDEHNKPIHEGIVIATFKPIWRNFKKYVIRNFKNEDQSLGLEEEVTEHIMIEAPVEPGDHIIYQHFEGIPVEHIIFKQPYYKSQNYVLVNVEVKPTEGRRGILAVLKDTKEDTLERLERLLDIELDKTQGKEPIISASSRIAKAIVEEFVISHLRQSGRTLPARGLRVTQKGEDR